MTFGDPITSRTNARVKALRASFNGEARHPGDVVGLEGEHLVTEALRSGLSLRTLFLREGSNAVLERPSLAAARGLEIVVLSRDVFDSAVETSAPQGIAALLPIPEWPAPVNLCNTGPLLLLESLQDPGNVGTLLRTAEAFETPYVMMTPDCVNPWNPKVLRASAGSVFRMPFLRNRLSHMRTSLPETGFTVYAAVAHAERALPLPDVVFADSSAVLIGNEGAGLSEEAVQMADVLVRIPCAVESLNAAVAGATILYEAMRQRLVRKGATR